MNNFRFYRKPERGEFFVVFADTSAGGLDYSACQFLSKTRVDVPIVYHSKKLATEMTNELAPFLARLYNYTGVKPTVAYENNAGGIFELERLAHMPEASTYDIFKMPNVGKTDNADSVKLGWSTNSATRPRMLADLKDAIDHRVLRVYDKPTINELFSFIVSQTSSSWKAQAEQGAHDDLVMSLAGAWQLYQLVQQPTGPVDPDDLPKYKPSDSVIGI